MGFIRHDLPYACVEFKGERLPWLGGDLQTVRTVFIDDKPSLPAYEEILIPVSDGDKILTAFHKAKQANSVLIVLHGLAGDYDSSYIARLTHLALAQNRHVLRVNLRGAGKGALMPNMPITLAGLMICTLCYRLWQSVLQICPYI